MEQRVPRDINECKTIESIKEEMDNLLPIVDKWFNAYIHYEEMYSSFEEKLNTLQQIEQTKQEEIKDVN